MGRINMCKLVVHTDSFGREYTLKAYDTTKDKIELNDIVVVPMLHLMGKVECIQPDGTLDIYSVSASGASDCCYKASNIPTSCCRLVGYAKFLK